MLAWVSPADSFATAIGVGIGIGIAAVSNRPTHPPSSSLTA
ncbi:MAG: hypothetical protein N838_30880 [Thiohalocapsa sp. PB-PSB1]|nr:MAG: hypothetical protein N838_30880 [Thiohalocapsa sp. PB-PSB1]